MKLHDLHPAAGSRTDRTRVGRGIAAGKGKTAGRGTKGQKSRTGSSIPAWFEGGQTPASQRIPKLRGFKRRFRVEYAVVNVGRINDVAAAGGFGEPTTKAPVAVNPDLLLAAGLIGSLRQPVKVLGQGEVDRRLFVVADAFTRSAAAKIEAAGGTAQVLEMPDEPLRALGIVAAEAETEAPSREAAAPDAAPVKRAPVKRAPEERAPRTRAKSTEPAEPAVETSGTPVPEPESDQEQGSASPQAE
jgi:large subunit ribosomal protein L15